MLILEINGLKKYYGERLILDIESLKIYSGEKIGLIGDNGAGKTTLLKILSGDVKPDLGSIKFYGSSSYIDQFGYENEYLSGGEKTKLKIKDALKKSSDILFADEPTSNLDLSSISSLQRKLQGYENSIVLISHDRTLLNAVCTKIIEIENGKIKIYTGNYDDYKTQKDLENKRKKFEYDQFKEEKERLEISLQAKKENVSQMRHTPKRMGNSEARLHKGGSSVKKSMEKAVKTLESRIERLEPKERYKEKRKIKIGVAESSKMSSKIALTVTQLNQSFGSRQLLSDVSFTVEAGTKTALIGDNGSGKTTIINKIINANGNDKNIKIAPSAKIAYFAQNLTILDETKTILENVKQDSLLNETELRTMLSRVRIAGSDVNKKVSVLSGGEKVKVSLIKIFSNDVNFLILDEPTNFLDIFVMEALEELMQSYNGTILFVTHDRELIASCAQKLLILKDKAVEQFDGTFEQYENRRNVSKSNLDEELLRLETRMGYCIGRLSSQISKDEYALLDEEYKMLVSQIRNVKNEIENRNG